MCCNYSSHTLLEAIYHYSYCSCDITATAITVITTPDTLSSPTAYNCAHTNSNSNSALLYMFSFAI